MYRKKNRTFAESLFNALNGLWYALKHERNMRFHLFATIVVLFFAWFYKITITDLVIILLTITFVIVCELINTAIEKAVDLSCQKFHPLAKVAKDVASAAVLMAALGSAIIGGIIFLKYFML